MGKVKKTKISKLLSANALTGDETVMVLQNGRNKKTSIEAIVSMATLSSGDFITSSSITEMKAQPLLSDKIYMLIDPKRGGIFYYDSTDNSTAEDNGMVFVSNNKRIKRITDNLYVNVMWFGAKGDDSTDDKPAIQAACNYALANSIKEVIAPVASYVLGSELILYKLNTSGAYVTFNLNLSGCVNANAGITFQSTKFKFTGNTTFGIGIQNARSCKISNILIQGQYVTSQSKTVKQVFEQDITSWSSSCRDETNSPYAGIVIDPFGTSTPVDGGYPGLSSFYKASAAGSSGVTVEECTITNFVVDYLVSAHNTANAESCHLKKCRLYSSKVAAAYGQPQTRGCSIEDCSIFECFNGIDTLLYGQQIGSAPNINGLLMSKLKNCLNIDTARGCFKADRIEAEAVWKIGICTGTRGATLTGCIFKFQFGNGDTGYAKAPDTLIYSNGGLITFVGCDFNKAGGLNWNSVWTGSNCIFVGGSNDSNNLYTSFQNGNSTTLIPGPPTRIRKKEVNVSPLLFHNVEPTSLKGNFASLGAVTITVNAGGDSTATFELSDTSKLKVGDILIGISTPVPFYFLQRNGLNSDTTSQIQFPFIGTVESIVSTTVTIKDTPFYLVSGSYNLSNQWTPVYSGSMIGKLASGDPIITDVYQEEPGFDYVGKRIFLTDTTTGIPFGAYVVSENKGARTMTLSAAPNVTRASAFLYSILFTRENKISGLPSAATNMYCEIGDIIDVHNSATKYICSSTGIVGNATHAPTFSTITTS